MKTLTYKGDCTNYDPAQIVGFGDRYFRFVHASYNSETDSTAIQLEEFHGIIFGSRGTVQQIERKV